jgi:hypothetical protein
MPVTPEQSQPDPGALWLRRSFTFAVLAFAWWRFSENTADNDLWGHVLYGRRMLHLGGLERTETLSWTAHGLPWINHEVLAEIALGAVHRLAGGTGLWLLMIGLAALTLIRACRVGAGEEPGQGLTTLALLALCTNFIALGYAVRPQLFTYLFFVLLLLALRRIGEGRRAWIALPPLLLAVWVNTHGGYLAGWLVLIIFVLTEAAARLSSTARQYLRGEPTAWRLPALAGLAGAGTLALCLNPWGWHLVAWTVETLRLPRPTITEWQPMGLSFATAPFYFTLLLGATAWARTRRPFRPWEPLVWSFLAFMAIRHQRHAPLFGLTTLMLLPAHVNDLAAQLRPATAGLRSAVTRPAVATGLAALLMLAGTGCLLAGIATRTHPFRIEVPRDEFPVDAIDFIRTHHLTGNTITFFDWGQQVLWELPDNPVSFDGRLDTVYPREIMDAHWRLYAGQEPGPALKLDEAAVALLPTASGGIGVLRRHGWSAAYADPLATVLTRAPATARARPDTATDLRARVPFPDAPPALASRP